MGALTEQFANKTPGQLIRSQDWNGLVAAIEDFEAGLNAQLAKVESAITEGLSLANARCDQLAGEVAELRRGLADLQTAVEPVVRDAYRLTLQTAKVRYALGELAEIEARVTTLAGAPLPLGPNEERPWIDFVTAWGQLKPAPGFTSLGSSGDRALSVQVNADGVARVRVRAEHAEGLPDEVDDEVASSLTTRLQVGGKSVVASILDARTPMEARDTGAFRTLAAEYDRRDAKSVRDYVDAYYVKNASLVAAPIFRRPIHGWTDYRATVLAFARRDSDPLTPDQSRGVSSIQVTFRDWVAPFLHLDYLGEVSQLANDLTGTLTASIVPDLSLAIGNLKAKVNETTRGQGLVGRQRRYLALRKAVDDIPDALGPAIVPDLKRTMRDAVSMQQTLDRSQFSTSGAEDDVAMEVLTNSAVRADAGSANVAGRVTEMQLKLDQVDRKVESHRQTVTAGLATVQSQVAQFTLLNPAEVNSKISEFTGRIAVLERQR